LILLLIATLLLLFLVELFDLKKLDVFFSCELLLILESLPLDASHFGTHLSGPYGRIFLMRGDRVLEHLGYLWFRGRPVTTTGQETCFHVLGVHMDVWQGWDDWSRLRNI